MNKRIKKEIETGCEYSFPDYMGDIKKILSCRAKCHDIGRLVADGVLEVNGVVEYEVLYADSENKLTAINTSSDYTVSAPINEDAFKDAAVVGRINNFSMRVTGPRKLSMRASVENEITLTHKAEMPVEGDALNEDNNSERCTRVIKIEDYLYGSPIEREYAEEAERLVGIGGEDIEIIAADGEVRITDANAIEGGAELRGELILYAIVKAPNEPPFRISKVIPISETVEVGGAEKEMYMIPKADVTSVSFGINDDGDDKVIVANAIITLSANAVTNEELEVITDAYLIENETKASYSDFEYETLSEIKSEPIEIMAKVPIANISPENIRCIISSAQDISEICATASGKSVEIAGKMSLNLIACEINADESIGYIPIKHSFDFVENVNINSQISDKTVIRCSISNPVIESLIDGDTIDVKCLLVATLSVGSSSSLKKLDSLEVTGEVNGETAASVSVYYPADGDTLFSVAKKYHKSLAAVAQVNNLADAVSISDIRDVPILAKKLFIV